MRAALEARYSYLWCQRCARETGKPIIDLAEELLDRYVAERRVGDVVLAVCEGKPGDSNE